MFSGLISAGENRMDNLGQQRFKAIDEPFGVGRPAFRLLFDLSIMLSCFKNDIDNKILDFGAGTCWIAEWLARMEYDVTAFDVSEDALNTGRMRVECDKRVNPDLIHFLCGDGHDMPFEDNSFSHICCFDSLHHMHNYPKVLSEFYRILIPDGRAIFIEPGAKHSTSKETIEFLEKYKKDDPTWIERDVVLEEIHQIAQGCGFRKMTVMPLLYPHLREYDFHTWQRFRQGDQMLEADYLNWLKAFNYDSHLAFYLDKGSPPKDEANTLMSTVASITGFARFLPTPVKKPLRTLREMVRRSVTPPSESLPSAPIPPLESLPNAPDLFYIYRDLYQHPDLERKPGGRFYKGRFYPDYLTIGGASHAIFREALKFCQGRGIDVGAGLWPLSGATPVDVWRGPGVGRAVSDFEDGSFDYVFSSHCLEHIETWQEALGEWIKKLKPGGTIFLYLPHPNCAIWHPGSPFVGDGHKWVPKPEVIRQILRELGCEIVQCDDGPDAMQSFYVCGRKQGGGNP